jgi:hypothetical protein
MNPSSVPSGNHEFCMSHTTLGTMSQYHRGLVVVLEFSARPSIYNGRQRTVELYLGKVLEHFIVRQVFRTDPCDGG